MFPLLTGSGPAPYVLVVIPNVSFGGSPPSCTVAVKVQPLPQLPLSVASAPTTVSEVTVPVTE